jgi:hypothetical protein
LGFELKEEEREREREREREKKGDLEGLEGRSLEEEKDPFLTKK